MLTQITKDEIEFMQCFYDSECMAEALFSDYDNFGLFDENKNASIRIGQLPLLSYEYLLDEDPKLSKQENFRLKEGAGNIECIGGRKFGKSLIVEKVDLLISMAILENELCGFSSYDKMHIEGMLEPVIVGLKHHPFFKMFNAQIKRSPIYRIYIEETGYLLESVNMNLSSPTPGCFDKDTEILTEDGFKFFKDLTYEDKVLTLNPENKRAYFCDIKKIIESDYNGYLKKLKSRTSEFLLTPNHNLLSITLNGNLSFKKLDGDLPKQIYSPATFNWNRKTDEYITLSGTRNLQPVTIKIKTEIWCKFIAWYLGEGWYKKHNHTKYSIYICQKNHCRELEQVLNDLGIKYRKKTQDKQLPENERRYIYSFYSKIIGQHLEKYFGRVKEKHIPKYFKNYNKKYLRIFIDEYPLGDGNTYLQKNKYEHRSVLTSLRQLADDLQEVAQKAGYKTHLKTVFMDTSINGYEYKNYRMFSMTLCRTKNTVFKKSLIEDVEYNDKVYCVEVEPHHTIFVRRNGCVTWSGNSNFYQKHFTRLYIEERAQETKEVYEARSESTSELGCVVRASGMTNFTRYSPTGLIFYEPKNAPWICNLPQYISPEWNDLKKEKAIKEHQGENSPSYRIYVKGEVVTEGIAVFDPERLRLNYLENKTIKNFELKKEHYNNFEEIIIVERLKNAEKVFICADVGESAPTEIVILFEVNSRYKYEYNITLYNMTDKEQFNIFQWLARTLEANFIGLDTSEGTGRAIFRRLEEVFGKERLTWVSYPEKIPVGFDKDEKGEVKIENGKPVILEEYVSEWSVKHLQDLFYEIRMALPMDYKLFSQLNSVISTKSGNRTVFDCVSDIENHLFNAFRVFSITQWNNEFNLNKSIPKSKFYKGVV